MLDELQNAGRQSPTVTNIGRGVGGEIVKKVPTTFVADCLRKYGLKVLCFQWLKYMSGKRIKIKLIILNEGQTVVKWRGARKHVTFEMSNIKVFLMFSMV